MERLVVEAQGSHNQNDESMKIIERRKSTKKVKKVKTKKKKKKEKIKKKGVGEQENTFTTLLTGMGGYQLQPGVEDGRTPIEVVAK